MLAEVTLEISYGKCITGGFSTFPFPEDLLCLYTL